MSARYVVRVAHSGDLAALLDLRLALFIEGGILGADDVTQQATVRQANQEYFLHHLDDAQGRSWVAEIDGKVIACGTLNFFQRAPYPGNLRGLEAYLLNMMTAPAWRRQGVARQILQQAIACARERGCARLWLHASDDGRPLYAAQGFQDQPAFMELPLSA